MLIMYKGLELVPVKDDEMWQAWIFFRWETNSDHHALRQ
jgi:hypothetical protein